jgi:hypothetical protein
MTGRSNDDRSERLSASKSPAPGCKADLKVRLYENSIHTFFSDLGHERGWSVMRTIQIRSLSLAALGLVVFAGGATASDKSPGLLDALEVRQLVARAESGDHARLAAHFTALASRYDADAKRHTSMSQSFVGNPTRNVGTGMSVHCTRLATLNTESAATVRELAAHHRKLAVGGESTAPFGGARFQGGAGAPDPTEQELSAMAAKARTTADHRFLEEYFVTLAKRYTTNANEHATLAQTYRGTRIAQAAAHCDRLVTLSRDSAKEATASATMHKQLAGVAQ